MGKLLQGHPHEVFQGPRGQIHSKINHLVASSLKVPIIETHRQYPDRQSFQKPSSEHSELRQYCRHLDMNSNNESKSDFQRMFLLQKDTHRNITGTKVYTTRIATTECSNTHEGKDKAKTDKTTLKQ